MIPFPSPRPCQPAPSFFFSTPLPSIYYRYVVLCSFIQDLWNSPIFKKDGAWVEKTFSLISLFLFFIFFPFSSVLFSLSLICIMNVKFHEINFLLFEKPLAMLRDFHESLKKLSIPSSTASSLWRNDEQKPELYNAHHHLLSFSPLLIALGGGRGEGEEWEISDRLGDFKKTKKKQKRKIVTF